MRKRVQFKKMEEKNSIRALFDQRVFCLLFMPRSKLFWEPRIFSLTLYWLGVVILWFVLFCFAFLFETICSWGIRVYVVSVSVSVCARIWMNHVLCMFMLNSKQPSNRVLFVLMSEYVYKHTGTQHAHIDTGKYACAFAKTVLYDAFSLCFNAVVVAFLLNILYMLFCTHSDQIRSDHTFDIDFRKMIQLLPKCFFLYFLLLIIRSFDEWTVHSKRFNELLQT